MATGVAVPAAACPLTLTLTLTLARCLQRRDSIHDAAEGGEAHLVRVRVRVRLRLRVRLKG
jgi:hypothetical protein